MKRPALQNKQLGVLRMAFRARKVFGTFEKRAPGPYKVALSYEPKRTLVHVYVHVYWSQKSVLSLHQVSQFKISVSFKFPLVNCH